MTNISIVFGKLVQRVWMKHFTQNLHTQQKLRTNYINRQKQNKMSSENHLDNNPIL